MPYGVQQVVLSGFLMPYGVPLLFPCGVLDALRCSACYSVEGF